MLVNCIQNCERSGFGLWRYAANSSAFYTNSCQIKIVVLLLMDDEALKLCGMSSISKNRSRLRSHATSTESMQEDMYLSNGDHWKFLFLTIQKTLSEQASAPFLTSNRRWVTNFIVLVIHCTLNTWGKVSPWLFCHSARILIHSCVDIGKFTFYWCSSYIIIQLIVLVRSHERRNLLS